MALGAEASLAAEAAGETPCHCLKSEEVPEEGLAIAEALSAEAGWSFVADTDSRGIGFREPGSRVCRLSRRCQARAS